MFLREMTEKQCRKALEAATFGRLACALDGQPYVTPVFFVVEEDSDEVYLFSLVGQKIDWMRRNPLVCLAIDHVESPSEWMSLLAFGSYVELLDSPALGSRRQHAHDLLESRATWWHPASGRVEGQDDRGLEPVFYCVHVKSLTGRRAVPDAGERILASAASHGADWRGKGR